MKSSMDLTHVQNEEYRQPYNQSESEVGMGMGTPNAQGPNDNSLQNARASQDTQKTDKHLGSQEGLKEA